MLGLDIKRRIKTIVALLTLCISIGVLPIFSQVPDDEKRPGNFVFLIDVSGSMLSKRTMVKSADGKEITLFEALRQALKQIVTDERLIGSNNKVAFITFGSSITDKVDWPENLSTSEIRKSLVEKIASPTELQADKHGDTYMAGALDQAYTRAQKFSSVSEPCATTFIIMLTDGWDEPPKGASLQVRTVAQRIIEKQRQLRHSLGVNTWQVRVVGLQRLPDRKAGTTTAAEVAGLLGGEFLDITQQSSGAVADRIFAAIKKTVDDLQGRIALAPPEKGGIAGFGLVEDGRQATATVKLRSHSCYGEKLNAVTNESAHLTNSQVKQLEEQLRQAKDAGVLKDSALSLSDCSSAGALPASALTFQLPAMGVPLTPTADQSSEGKEFWQPVTITAHVDNHCPPGNFVGALKMASTARSQDLIPFIIRVPSRIVIDSDEISCRVRKPGFFFAEATKGELKFKLNPMVSAHQDAAEHITIEPSEATNTKDNSKFSNSLINKGKPFEVNLNTGNSAGYPVTLSVDIPAEQTPGKYTGAIKLKLDSSSQARIPGSLRYVLEIQPSPWEEVRPIAIPIFILLALFLVIGTWLTITSRRS